MMINRTIVLASLNLISGGTCPRPSAIYARVVVND